jgi:hypothetical protein
MGNDVTHNSLWAHFSSHISHNVPILAMIGNTMETAVAINVYGPIPFPIFPSIPIVADMGSMMGDAGGHSCLWDHFPPHTSHDVPRRDDRGKAGGHPPLPTDQRADHLA